MRSIVCRVCLRVFEHSNPKAALCSTACRNFVARSKVVTANRPVSLPSGTVGALNELVAAAYLMRLGYHVFRAISPASPFDLFAFGDDGKKLRVEVTTGHRYTRSNKPTLGNFFSGQKIERLLNGEFDVLLVVFGESVEMIRTKADVNRYKAGKLSIDATI